MICNEDHSNLHQILSTISYDQGGGGRHKCCGCAYIRGYSLGEKKIENFNLEKELNNLPDNQKNSQVTRHSNSNESFMVGYIEGRKQAIKLGKKRGKSTGII